MSKKQFLSQENEETANRNGAELWSLAKELFRKKLGHIVSYKGPYGVDSVKIQLQDPYLNQAIKAPGFKHLLSNNKFFSYQELTHKYWARYDTELKCLSGFDGRIFTTCGLDTKEHKDSQIFLYTHEYTISPTKEYPNGLIIPGILLVGPHTAGMYYSIKIDHSSYLEGAALQMAGLISIDKLGRICKISDSSGHYQPDAYDMYRFVISILKRMPGALADKVTIDLTESHGTTMGMTSFLKYMEGPSSNDDPRAMYQVFREARIKSVEYYEESLYSKPLFIDLLEGEKISYAWSTTRPINQAFTGLSAAQLDDLRIELQKPEPRIIIREYVDPNDRKALLIRESKIVKNIVRDMIQYGNEATVTNLLNCGIYQRPEFKSQHVIHRALFQNSVRYINGEANIDFIKALFSHPCVVDVLKKELQGSELKETSLHTIAKHSQELVSHLNNEIYNLIKYPEYILLCEKRDSEDKTPFEYAKEIGNLDSIYLFRTKSNNTHFSKQELLHQNIIDLGQDSLITESIENNEEVVQSIISAIRRNDSSLIFEYSGFYIEYTIFDFMSIVASSKTIMNTLIKFVGKEEAFINSKPLYHAINKSNQDAVNSILADENLAKEILLNELEDNNFQTSSLHLCAKTSDSTYYVKSLLKFKESLKLLQKHDSNGKTPISISNHEYHFNVEEIMRKALYNTEDEYNTDYQNYYTPSGDGSHHSHPEHQDREALGLEPE